MSLRTQRDKQPNNAAPRGQTFQTQPNIPSSHARSSSHNPRHQANQPMYKSHLGKPPSLERSPNVPTENNNYSSPPTRLTDGIYKRLYEPTGTNFFNPQKYASGQLPEVMDQNMMRRTNMQPQFTDMESYRTLNTNYNSARNEPAFPNTPFKQNMHDSNEYRVNMRDSASYRNSPYPYPQDLPSGPQNPNNYYSSPNPREIPPHPQRPQQYQGSLQNLSEERSSLREQYEDEEEEKKKKRRNTPEPYSPRFSATGGMSIKPPPARIPTLGETAKMRNPMFANYDYADYEKSMNQTNLRFKPNAYNYASVDPVAPKEFLKSHVSTVAQARRYDMEQQTKMHAQLGVLAGERRPTPILKPFIVEREPRNLKATVRQAQEPPRQWAESARLEVNPTRSNVGFSASPQPYQESRGMQPKEVASARLKYANDVMQGDHRQSNRNMFAENVQQEFMREMNKQQAMSGFIDPMRTTGIEKRYDRSYGQYAQSYRAPVGYPW